MVAFFVPQPGATTGREQRHRGGAAAKAIGTPSRLHDRPRARADAKQGGQPTMAPTDSQANQEAHWDKTTKLMFWHLGIWVFFGYIVHMFVYPLNKITIPILQFPLGFYMAAQGSLIAFVVMLFVFAKQQDKIDRDHGYAEDD
jgi:putative solute:sodium symporter small subunit